MAVALTEVNWSSAPPSVPPNCPPGLEYLAEIDQVVVQQQVEMLEVFTGWETKNKYKIMNAQGQQIYFAAEESGECWRQCGGSDRPFVMHITDSQNKEVMRVSREQQCCRGCCCCVRGDTCAYKCDVMAPADTLVARVRQTFSWWSPRMEILDENDKPFFKIAGPCCLCQAICCTADLEFVVTDMHGTEIGKIAKKWDGLARDLFTDADTFGVTFPKNLDVRKKAALIGAVFHVDFSFFEDDNDDNHDH